MKLEKLPSGNYRIRVTVGYDADGKRIRKSFTGSDKTKLRRIAAEYADTHRGNGSRQSVGDAMAAFLTAKKPVLSPSTLRAYTSMDKTLKAKYGRFYALAVASVGVQDMQKLINDMLKNGSTPKTIKNYHGLLSAAFKYAGYNLPPVTLPQQGRPDINIPDEATMHRIMDAAKGTDLEIPLALASFGLRRSEICALTVEDLTGSILHIHRAAVYGSDKAIHTKLPKNYTSDRHIRIPDDLAEKIRKQGYITEMTPAALSHAYNRLLEKNDIPHFRLHDLRHFFVSYCHNVLKLSDAQIQTITGHKTSVVLRNNYLHSMNDDQTGQLVSDNLAKFM